MNKTSTWMLAMAVVLMAGVARAAELTIEQVEQRKFIQERLDNNMALANKACGAKATISLDWGSLKGQDTSNKNLSQYCSDNVVSEMRNLCSEGDARKAQMSKIKKVVCRYGETNKSTYAAGTVTAQFSWNLDGSGNEVNATLRTVK